MGVRAVLCLAAASWGCLETPPGALTDAAAADSGICSEVYIDDSFSGGTLAGWAPYGEYGGTAEPGDDTAELTAADVSAYGQIESEVANGPRGEVIAELRGELEGNGYFGVGLRSETLRLEVYADGPEAHFGARRDSDDLEAPEDICPECVLPFQSGKAYSVGLRIAGGLVYFELSDAPGGELETITSYEIPDDSYRVSIWVFTDDAASLAALHVDRVSWLGCDP